MLALLPMDAIAHEWNKSRIRAGHLAPSVQLAVQAISDEGLLCLLPLLSAEETEIREGVKALLATRIVNGGNLRGLTESPNGWTQIQGSRDLLEYHLKEYRDVLDPFVVSRDMRQQAMNRFKEWTSKWY